MSGAIRQIAAAIKGDLILDQRKIGEFLRKLRKEKGWTQMELADQLGVSNRSVSRWENGTTLPDLSLLLVLSELYAISLDEILDGRKKDENMTENQTIRKVADYSTLMEQKRSRRMMWLFVAAFITLIGYAILESLQLTYTEPWESISSMMLGFTCGVLLTGVLYCSSWLQKIARTKLRLKSFILDPRKDD